MPAVAKPVPLFEVRCTEDANDRYALTAKWDGKTLHIKMRTFINIEWKKPESRYFQFPVVDGNGEYVIDIGFRDKEITIPKGGRKGQKQYAHVTLQFLTNTAGKPTRGDFRIAHFNDGILVDARSFQLAMCSTALRP